MGFAVRTLDSAVAPVWDDVVPVNCKVTGPVGELSFLRRSLLFSELSAICYLSRAEAGRLAFRIGFPEIRYYERDGAQAYIFGNDHDRAIVCRGTEPNDWNDIRADLDLATVIAETAGRVHRGFKREVDDLWPRLEQALRNNTLPLWFAGHSLGGAMATICASRCKLSYIKSNPRALYTYGSPRVGNRQYIDFVEYEAYRWVNNNDIVTRVPPWWLGYRHKGQEVYLDSRGEIRRLTAWQRIKDRWRGFVGGLRKWEFDHFTDHSITRYVDYIRRAVEVEESFDHKILSFRRPTPAPTRSERRAA
ncbi:MAG: lipase family protein [Pirellulales bacterium]